MKKKVLIIGLDGARPDSVLVANTPNIDELALNGLYSWTAQTEIQTISGPAWTSLLTGVHSDKHNVFDNNFKSRNREYRTLFSLLKELNPNLRICAHSNWKPIITQIFEKGILNSKSSGNDKKMTKNLIKDIEKNNGDLYFIQLDEIDGAGHKYTYSPDVKEYVNCIEERDLMIGEIMATVNTRPSTEEWLIIVVSDHGGSGHGHGKPVMEDLTILFLVSGKSITKKGEIQLDDEDEFVQIVDIVPTIAKFLNYPQKEYWDGVPRGI